MESNKKKKPGKQLKNAAVLMGIGIQMGVTIYLFVILGKWLDSKYSDGGKLFLIVGTLLGVAISIYVVLQELKRFND